MGSTLHSLTLPFGRYPRPNTLLDHQMIWWSPIISDFSFLPRSGPMSGLGKLCQPRYNELRTSLISLENRVKKYQESTPPNLPLSNHLSSGSNKSLINSSLSKCPFVILNSSSEIFRGYGSMCGPYSTIWKFINLAWMALLFQAMV